ncbi:MAG: hypothetical protein MZW92_64980 [Comamonadaceae bacterium]|nr:hypothetical protein [Comamonadaceae bacterium]
MAHLAYLGKPGEAPRRGASSASRCRRRRARPRLRRPGCSSMRSLHARNRGVDDAADPRAGREHRDAAASRATPAPTSSSRGRTRSRGCSCRRRTCGSHVEALVEQQAAELDYRHQAPRAPARHGCGLGGCVGAPERPTPALDRGAGTATARVIAPRRRHVTSCLMHGHPRCAFADRACMQQPSPGSSLALALALLAPRGAVAAAPRRAASRAAAHRLDARRRGRCSARDERRVYRQLREALPHHIVLSKLPLVRFCQPTDPNEVRFWYELLGSTDVTFAICSANGRVLAAIDLDTERGDVAPRAADQAVGAGAPAACATCAARWTTCRRCPSCSCWCRRPCAAARGPQPRRRRRRRATSGQRRAQRRARAHHAVAGLGLLAGLVLRRRRPGSESAHGQRASATCGARHRRSATRRTRRDDVGGVVDRHARRRRLPALQPDYADLDTAARCWTRSTRSGLRGDGRILQLNSYENRVFQVFLEDGRAVVAKFYRPGRWSDAQIVEEHAFALELAAAEVPVVPPLVLTRPHWRPARGCCTASRRRWPAWRRRTHRFAVAARCAGREPELDDPGTLARHRPLHRPPARGRPPRGRSRTGTTLDAARRRPARAGACCSTAASSPPDQLPAWQRRLRAGAGRGRGGVRARRGRWPTLRLHGDCHPRQRAVARRRRAARRRPRRRHAAARRCRTCGCWSRATRRRWRGSSNDAAGRLRAVQRLRRPRARADRAAAHAAHDAPQRLAGRALERPDLPAQLSVLRHRGLLEPADARSCASRSRSWPAEAGEGLRSTCSPPLRALLARWRLPQLDLAVLWVHHPGELSRTPTPRSSPGRRSLRPAEQPPAHARRRHGSSP